MSLKFVPGRVVWRDGRLEEVNPQEAIRLPVLSQALDYSRVAISGMRITPHFQEEETLLIFCLEEHLYRLLDSCQKLGFGTRFTLKELSQGAAQVVVQNWDLLKSGGYMRAVAYDTHSVVAPQPRGPVEIIIFAGQFGEYIPEGNLCLTFDDILRTGHLGEAKAAANYLAFGQAKARGMRLKANDVIGITTGSVGQLVVGEGTTSNLFAVVSGKIRTAPLGDGILAGITRARVIELARDRGFAVEDREHLPLSLIPFAEELFLTGTASYVAPVTHLGIHSLKTDIGNLLNHYLRLIMAGKLAEYQKWNTTVRRVAPKLLTV